MQDALDALRTAIDELRQARQTLPEELAAELDAVIERAEAVIASVRVKAPDAT